MQITFIMLKHTYNKYCFFKRLPGVLRKQLKAIFLGRKERRNGQMRGNHPHTLGKQIPASGATPQPARQQARGHRCGRSGGRLHTGPLCSMAAPRSMRSRWPRRPRTLCFPSSHTSDAAGFEPPARQSAFHFIGREKLQRKEGGRP